MFSYKPKSVYGQALAAFCLLLVLTVFEPAFAKSGGKLDPDYPEISGNLTSSGMGRISLASIKIDTASQYTGQLVEVPIMIRNDVEFGGFEMEVDFPYQNFTFIGAERGLALSDTSNGEYNWESFRYRLLPFPSSPLLYKCFMIGLYDLPNGPHVGIPLAPHSDYVSLVILKFVIDNRGASSGTFLPIIFEWEGSIVNDTVVADWDCAENTFADSTGNTLYVSHNRLQYDTTICGGGPGVILGLEFLDGGVYTLEDSNQTGDINVNSVPYEVADLVCFQSFLLHGDSVLINPEQQAHNSDVNWDDFRWSMADFIHLSRVINHDASPAFNPTSLSQNSVQTWMPTMHALPNDTVFLPVIYHGCSGSEPVYGISFKVDYNPDSLTLIRVDFSKTTLQNWQAVYTRLEDGSVWVNACPEFFTTSLSSPFTVSSSYQELGRLSFRVADVDTPVFIPVRFSTDTTLQIQPNAFATIDGPLTRLGVSGINNGGIQVGGQITCKRGDVNFNYVAYEVADWVFFENFLTNGPGVLIYDPEAQTCASDVNCDYLYWTIADHLYLCRVILHDADEIPCKYQELALPQPSLSPPENQDKFQLVSSSAHPGETVSVPIWLSNTLDAFGVTLNVVFDSTFLSIEGVNVSQTRIEEWGQINPVINPDQLFLFSHPDWWDIPNSVSRIKSGVGILLNINFRVQNSVPAGTFLPITFQTDSALGHYNAYTDTTGLIFVQPSTLSGWIYTDVISGDANSDGVVDVGDVVYLINYLYRADMPPSPVSLGDFNHDSEVNISDVVALINYLFRN